jgi:hypothetical protein
VALPVIGQDFFVPPLINLFKYSLNQDTASLPNMRIWGWANDKIAYTIETERHYEKSIQFYVQNLATNEFIFSYVTDEYSNFNDYYNDYYSDPESMENIRKKIDMFKTFGIVYFNNPLHPFPINYNNEQYRCTINIEYNVNKRIEKYFVKSYSITVEMPDSKSIIKTFSGLNYLWVELCGYFINPVDNKLIVVICEKRYENIAYYKFILIN